MATKPKLTAEEKKERKERAFQFSLAIVNSTVINEVLDQTDGVYTGQVNRIALELTDDFMRRTA